MIFFFVGIVALELLDHGVALVVVFPGMAEDLVVPRLQGVAAAGVFFDDQVEKARPMHRITFGNHRAMPEKERSGGRFGMLHGQGVQARGVRAAVGSRRAFRTSASPTVARISAASCFILPRRVLNAAIEIPPARNSPA